VAVIMSNSGIVCCVCYGALESDKTGVLGCGHIIHVRCWQDLVSHWKSNGTRRYARCPYCKTEVSSHQEDICLYGMLDAQQFPKLIDNEDEFRKLSSRGWICERTFMSWPRAVAWLNQRMETYRRARETDERRRQDQDDLDHRERLQRAVDNESVRQQQLAEEKLRQERFEVKRLRKRADEMLLTAE
jgi:hypothetical protein